MIDINRKLQGLVTLVYPIKTFKNVLWDGAGTKLRT